MEQTVFSKPEAAKALEGKFVLVKLNADDSRATAMQYKVSRLPTDVIITPSGQLVASIASPSTAEEYVAQMNRAADDYLRANQSRYAVDAPRRPDAQPANNAYSQATQPTTPAPNQPAPQYGQTPAAQDFALRPPVNEQPQAAKPTLFGLDGFCPVTLVDQKKWAPGDKRFGAVHRGRTYLFASAEAQTRFLANPDAYSPVMQGNDPVLAFDERHVATGRREHGVFFDQRIYLFSSEETLNRFQQNPKRYAAEVLQAMR